MLHFDRTLYYGYMLPVNGNSLCANKCMHFNIFDNVIDISIQISGITTPVCYSEGCTRNAQKPVSVMQESDLELKHNYISHYELKCGEQVQYCCLTTAFLWQIFCYHDIYYAMIIIFRQKNI